jgi:hypothetical protein
MKKLICIAALVIGISPFAQAQVYFGSGSARPLNPGAATRDIERQPHARPHVKSHRVLATCRDGSKHISRVCRRHGGVAGR